MSGVLAAPQLRLYNISNNQQLVIADNTGWSNSTNAAAIASKGLSVGAFPLQTGGQDSAMLLVLPPGSYTAQVSGVGNTTGIALIEVYEIP